MRSKTFVILVVIFCILGLAALFSFKQGRSQRQTQIGERLFDHLAVNSVARIRLVGPDGEVRLEKGAEAWEVKNLYGYPADFDKITELVKKLMNLKVGRTFAADSDVRERLALFTPQETGARPVGQKGTRVLLADGDDRVMADILVGKARETDGGTAGGHHLMRLEPNPSDSVYLVDGSFRFLNTDPADWLVKDLVDVNADDVQQVDCFNIKSGTLLYRLSRSEKAKPVVLEGLTEKETLDVARIERVFGALAGLTIDGVRGDRGAVDITGFQTSRRFEYRLFDGTVYTLETAKRPDTDGDQNYLTVAVAYHPPAAPEEKVAAQKAAQGDTAGKEATDPAESARQADERLRPWTYTISTWKYEAWVADRDGLLSREG